MLVAITDAARTQGLTQTPAAVLERLYVAHRDSVVRYLRAVSPTEDDAIETTAVVFERAFAQLGQDPTRELGLPWLLRTARNATIDQSRRRTVRRVAVTQIGSVMPTDPGPSPAISPGSATRPCERFSPGCRISPGTPSSSATVPACPRGRSVRSSGSVKRPRRS